MQAGEVRRLGPACRASSALAVHLDDRAPTSGTRLDRHGDPQEQLALAHLIGLERTEEREAARGILQKGFAIQLDGLAEARDGDAGFGIELLDDGGVVGQAPRTRRARAEAIATTRTARVETQV